MAKSTAGAKKSTTAKAPAKPRTPKKSATPGTPDLAPAAALARPAERSKFTLYNLLGKPRAYYLVETAELPREASKTAKKGVAHSIIVVDRSGSMTYDLPATKETLLKI